MAARLITGTGGNLSIVDKHRKYIAISPSAMAYDRMTPEDVVICDLKGHLIAGHHKPSSEIQCHLAFYHQRPDVGAVVHTHSIYATTFACLNREIPAIHYLIGYCGEKIPLAPYATAGSKAMARLAGESIGGANAVLLANHGLMAVGADMAKAFNVAEVVEMMARLYYQSLCIGQPHILNHAEISELVDLFEDYGKP